MRGILGTLLLLMITASVQADTSANDTSTATQDSGPDGDLASAVSHSEPSRLQCVPFCLPPLGKREIHAAALAAERMPGTKVQRRFQPDFRRSIVDKSQFTSLTIPGLIDRKRKALTRQRHMREKQNTKDGESVASYKRGVTNQSLLPARLQ